MINSYERRIADKQTAIANARNASKRTDLAFALTFAVLGTFTVFTFVYSMYLAAQSL